MQKKSIHISESFLTKAKNRLHQNKDAIYQVISLKIENCNIPRAFDLIEMDLEKYNPQKLFNK